jgi:hypothetical protein
MKQHQCCYINCSGARTVPIGENRNLLSQWICDYHRDKWNRDRSRFIADGLSCEMEEL